MLVRIWKLSLTIVLGGNVHAIADTAAIYVYTYNPAMSAERAEPCYMRQQFEVVTATVRYPSDGVLVATRSELIEKMQPLFSNYAERPELKEFPFVQWEKQVLPEATTFLEKVVGGKTVAFSRLIDNISDPARVQLMIDIEHPRLGRYLAARWRRRVELGRLWADPSYSKMLRLLTIHEFVEASLALIGKTRSLDGILLAESLQGTRPLYEVWLKELPIPEDVRLPLGRVILGAELAELYPRFIASTGVQFDPELVERESVDRVLQSSLEEGRRVKEAFPPVLQRFALRPIFREAVLLTALGRHREAEPLLARLVGELPGDSEVKNLAIHNAVGLQYNLLTGEGEPHEALAILPMGAGVIRNKILMAAGMAVEPLPFADAAGYAWIEDSNAYGAGVARFMAEWRLRFDDVRDLAMSKPLQNWAAQQPLGSCHVHLLRAANLYREQMQ